MARRHLESGGYTILDTNYRTRSGEIDLIAEKDGVLVFVEARIRRGTVFGSPEESITARKRSRLVQTAEEYIQLHREGPTNWRIDLIGVQLDARGKLVRLNVVENAVEL